MRFLGTKPKLINTEIKGNDTNIVYCEPGVTLLNSSILFFGNNALIYLSSGMIQANFSVDTNSVIFMGKNNYFPLNYTGMANPFIRAAKNTRIILGSECPISTGVCIESGDGHEMFDLTTGKRVSKNGNIYIGDAVWLGRDCHILKNTILNTGTTVGTSAVITGKHTKTGEVWAGVPARCIKENVVYGHMNQTYLGQDERYKFWNSVDAFKYNENEEVPIEKLEQFKLEDFQKLQITNGRFIWKQ